MSRGQQGDLQSLRIDSRNPMQRARITILTRISMFFPPSPLLLNLGNFKQGEIKHRKLNGGEQKARKRRPTELCGHVVQADVVGGGGGVGAVWETGQEPVAQQAQTLLLPAHPPLTLLPVFNILLEKKPTSYKTAIFYMESSKNRSLLQI